MPIADWEVAEEASVEPPPAQSATSDPWAVASEVPVSHGTPATKFNTPLAPDEERQFQQWKGKYAPRDSGEDYDLRGAFKMGLTPDPATGHWPDTFKKPNHPTFSNESQYAQFAPDKAGHWQGETYIPAGKGDWDVVSESPAAKASTPQYDEPSQPLTQDAGLDVSGLQPNAPGAPNGVPGMPAPSLPAGLAGGQAAPNFSGPQSRPATAPLPAQVHAPASYQIGTENPAAPPAFVVPSPKAAAVLRNVEQQPADEFQKFAKDMGDLKDLILGPEDWTVGMRDIVSKDSTNPAARAARGILTAADTLLTPRNIELAALVGGSVGAAGSLVPSATVGKLIQAGATGYFGAQALKSALDSYPKAKADYQKGDWDAFAEDLGYSGANALLAAWLGYKGVKEFRGAIEPAIEQHNAAAAEALKQEGGQGVYDPKPGKFILGAKTIPVDINGEPFEIRSPGVGSGTERPYYEVVEKSSGDVKYGGYGADVQTWLQQRGAKLQTPPVLEEPAPIVRQATDIARPTAEKLPEVGETHQIPGGGTLEVLDVTPVDGKEPEIHLKETNGPVGDRTFSRPLGTYRSMIGANAPTPSSAPAAPPSAAAAQPEPIAPAAPAAATVSPSVAAPQQEGDVRRVTGSTPIPLSAEGVKQGQEMAANMAHPFDQVVSGPSERTQQMARLFGKPVVDDAFDASHRGALEGQPADAVKDQVGDLLTNPEKPAPGVSPTSGQPGETQSEFEKTLLQGVQKLQAQIQPDQRMLVVTHGADLQAINAWAKAGQPADLQFNREAMAKEPYYSKTGQLFLFDKNGLKPVENNTEPGLYFTEHGSTRFNPAKPSAPPEAPVSANAEKPATTESAAGQSKIADLLGSAKRTYKVGGERMEEADPRAQLILKSLTPEDQATVDSLMADAKNPKVLASGFDHVVLDLGNGKVMRLGRIPQHEAESKYIAKPAVSREIGNVGVEIYPKFDTSGITDKDVEGVKADLAKQGLKWDDAAKDNLARDKNGDLKIIDGQVQKGAPEKRDYSSSQFGLPEGIAASIKRFAANIPDEDLAPDTKGREDDPHITVKYGLHTENPAALKAVVAGEKPVQVKIGRTSVFKTDDADVLKLDIESPELHALNKKVGDSLEHTDTHPEYVPHATVAYIRKGLGDKYAGRAIAGATGMKPVLDIVTFSRPNEEKTEIPLNAQAPAGQQFNEGDKVTWTQGGKVLTGTIRNIDSGDGTASIDTDQIATIGGRIPIGRIDTVKLDKLSAIAGTQKPVEPETAPAPLPPGKQAGAAGLAEAVYQKLKNGDSLGNVTEFNKLAEQYFGSSRTSGAWTPKDAFDAMEAGVNKHLIDRGADLLSMPYEQAMTELRGLMERITSQGVRTDEQIKAQQFSTPPTEAFTAAKVASLTPADTMLETSAGNGGLAVFPKSIGARVYVNEISDRRRQMLEFVGFPNPTEFDGEVINALLDPGIRPTVVIMNPPFSAGAAKAGPAVNNNKYGFNHVDSALQRLAPNGRLVAILGGGRADDLDGGASLTSGPSGKWFNELAKRYNVRANVRVHGREYQKYGTSFATRIIVIDKTGATPSRVSPKPSWDSVVKGVANTLEEAYALLKDVAESRPAFETALANPAGLRGAAEVESGGDQVGTGDVASGRAGGVLQGRPGPVGTSALGGESEPGRFTGNRPGDEPGVLGEPTGVRQPRTRPEEPAETPTPGAAQGSAQNGDLQRPLPNQPGDLTPGTGLTRQQLIEAAAQRLAEKTGRTRSVGSSANTPTPPSKPENAMSAAADEARQRLRDKLRKQPPGDPVRYSYEYRAEPDPIDAETLIDLSSIGAEHILNGATTYPEWSARFSDDVGDLVGEISKTNKQSVPDILRQVYDLSREVAGQFGGKAEAPPPPIPEELTKTALDGSEANAPPLEIDNSQTTKAEEEDSAAYVTYRPTLSGPEHPGAIVETKTMSTVPLPPITYRPHLPESVIKEGRLSAVQLEAISIAGQQNQIILPSGHRASALIGDGTGVGKGREAAGYLWDLWRQGVKRLVWVSVKWDLMQDAMRDLDGIGAKDELLRGNDKKANGQYASGSTSSVQPFQRYKYGDKVDHKGVLFSTYALIRSENNKGQKRAQQLEDYLRGEDDGDGAAIVFDEAHTMKNAVVGGQGAKPSQIGVAIKDLMMKIPKLRSVSLSATAATDVMNLGYLDRLGLWGPGTPFPTGFGEFAAQISGGRLAAMEMVARELKAQGKYLSRTLSFKGVTYSEEEHVLSPEQKELYKTAAVAWKSVIERAEHAIMTTTNGGARQRARFLANLGAAQQRFFNLLITALKTPTAIDLANKALADGKSVVLTLVNTNEAAQNREKNKAAQSDDEDEIPDYDFGPKNIIIDLIKEHFPIHQFADDVDDNGNPIKVPVMTIDDQGREIQAVNPEAKATRDALMAQIDRDLHMPENPLDIVINALGGPNKVAELTGRKERYDSSVGKFIPRGGEGVARKDVNLSEMRNFQTGKKRVAILSAAADTGISLHAGLDVPNQQKRYHITLQVGWSADKAMQMFGRTHRTNQAHPPEYVLLVSDLGGEKRFISTIARRLGSLGALTKGQKNATSGTDLMDKVNFETEQGVKATGSFYNALMNDAHVPGTALRGRQILADLRVLRGDPPTVPLADRGNVTRLLNRLLALEPDAQNPVYNYFYDIFQAVVERAIEAGTLDTGVKTLPGDEFTVTESRGISKDPQTGAETFYYPVDAKVRNNRISPEELQKRFANHESENARIMFNDQTKKLAFVYDARPIVHASGTVEPASYVATAGKGRPDRVANSRLTRATEIREWAAEKLQDAKSEAESNARAFERRKLQIENTKNYEKQRAERMLRGQLSQAEARLPYDPTKKAEIESLNKKIAALKDFELPDDNWEVRSLAEAQKLAEDAKVAHGVAEEIAKDPMRWAREEWGRQYEDAPSHTTERHHLIGGAVMRFWNPIREATGLTNIYTAVDSKTGQRVVGVDVPSETIGSLLQRITGGASTVNTRQLILDVLRNNLPYTLEGNIQVRRGRVGREFVIQLQPANPEQGQNLRSIGVLHERGVVPIYYIPNAMTGPTEQQQHSVMSRVLDQYPIKTEQPAPDEEEGEEPSRFTHADVTNIDEGPRAEYRSGILWVNPDMMKRIAQAIGGPKNVGGIYIPVSEAWDLPDRIGALGSVQQALREAIANERPIVVVMQIPGEPISKTVTRARHELFHASERWGGGGRAPEFMKQPLAEKAAKGLGDRGYDSENPVLMFSEIGAHLFSGPTGWSVMGVDKAEAKALFAQYARLLPPEVLARLNKITPALKEELYAERSIRSANLGQSSDRATENPEQGLSGEPLRRSIRSDVPGEKGDRANTFVVGGVRLTNLQLDLQKKFGDDSPRANYTGLGAAARIFLPGRGLAEVEQASTPVFRSSIRAASSEAISSNLIANAVPAIIKALKGSGVTWDDMRLYYTESRLRGLRARWRDFATEAESMTPEEFEQAMAPAATGGVSPFIDLLSKIEGRAGLNQNLAQTATALAEVKDWDTLRHLVTQSFNDAADHVATVTPPGEFEYLHDKVANDPQVKEADRLYGYLIEKPIAENHALNEGVFSDALGPAGRYIPLVPFERAKMVAGPGRRLPFHKPRNIANAFATGLSSGYDLGMESFARRVSTAMRANDKASLIQTAVEEKWFQPETAGFKTEDGLSMTGPDGVTYKAVREEVTQGRTIIKDRKVIHTPARFGVMPLFMHRALFPILGRAPMDANEVIALMRWANMLATKGPLELVYHSSGVLGALYANTPFLGKSGLDKALSVPLLKWFTLRAKLAADPTLPENVEKLRKMAEAGAVPARSGKVTYSKTYASETGAKREFSFAPLLYGPKGIDARARILMYDIFEAAFPPDQRTPENLHHFVNQLGNYTPEMQSVMERGLKRSGIGPFATAGMTRIVNGLNTMAGTGPQKGGTLESKISWWLTSSALIALAAWIVAHKLLTGNYLDKRSKFMKIPVGGGHGFIDSFRHSKLGNMFWGTGSNIGYLDFGFFDNPLVERGARAMGIPGAFEAKMAGGNLGQMSEAAQKDILNSFAHPVMGPAARALFVGLLGVEPYLTDLRERTGAWKPQLYPAIPVKTKQGLPAAGARAWAATRELNNFFADSADHLGEFTGFSSAPKYDIWGRPVNPQGRGNWAVQAGTNLVAPGLVGLPSNPYAKATVLRQQRAGTR